MLTVKVSILGAVLYNVRITQKKTFACLLKSPNGYVIIGYDVCWEMFCAMYTFKLFNYSYLAILCVSEMDRGYKSLIQGNNKKNASR